ncbi:MAG: S-layer family protein [Phormidesmis sp.]
MASGRSAVAQVVPDETLGAETSRVESDNPSELFIRGGAQRQENLFHSFERFSINEGQQITFDNPLAVQRVFSRVTGNLPSDILGTLRSTGTADVFLLNPNGVVFGPNARLDVGGSFAASTADAFAFGELGSFSARRPEVPSPLLTIQPSAFLFGQVLPQEIVVRSVADNTGLSVPDGENFLLLGGDILLDGGKLSSLGGQIELAAAMDAGTVELAADGGLTFVEEIERGRITIKNEAAVTLSSVADRGLGLTARTIEILNSRLLAETEEGLSSTDAQAGDITLNAVEFIRLSDSRVFNSSQSGDIGKGGNIEIITNRLELLSNALISTSTLGASDGGDLVINAQVVEVLDDSQLSSSTSGDGDAGNIIIVASESVRFADRREVEAPSIGRNQSSVMLTAASSGTVPNFIFDDITGEVVGFSFPTGSGGNIDINTPLLEVIDGAQLAVDTAGEGDAGDIIINAQVITVTNGAGLSSNTGAEGNAGSIIANAQVLKITDGARLTSSTRRGAAGDAGDIVINANELVRLAGQGQDRFNLDGSEKFISSGILSASEPAFTFFTSDVFIEDAGEEVTIPASTGNGGSININTPILEVLDSAQISSRTQGEGNAGDIVVSAADRITLSNGDILADSESIAGQGGDIFIDASLLTLTDQSEILAQTLSTDGGNISFTLSDLLLLRDNSIISTEAGTNGSGGDGGDITVDTRFIVSILEGNNDIIANAFDGSGGSVDITATEGIFGIAARDSRTPQSDITASSQNGASGDVNIQTPELDPSQGTVELPVALVGPEVVRSCRETFVQSGSEFVISGRGGLLQGPLDPTATALWQDVLPVENAEEEDVAPNTVVPNTVETINNRVERNTTVPILEAQGFGKNEKGETVLVATVLQPLVAGHEVSCKR